MPPPLQKHVQSCSPTKITQHSYENLIDACEGANVLHATRIQQEQFDDAEKKNNKHEETIRHYRIDLDLLQDPRVPLAMVLLHPLPRIDEIHTQVDSDPCAAYFRQVENGKLIRMALLSLLLGKACVMKVKPWQQTMNPWQQMINPWQQKVFLMFLCHPFLTALHPGWLRTKSSLWGTWSPRKVSTHGGSYSPCSIGGIALWC